jgi:polyisoprenoid-binding protein YceI
VTRRYALASLAILIVSVPLYPWQKAIPASTQSPPEVRRTEAPSGEYKLDKAHASLVWRINHWGLSRYTARFTRFDAQLQLDAEAPERSMLVVTIDPSSVETDYPGPADFDGELRGNRFFDASAHPSIEFRSSRVQMAGPNRAQVTGNLAFLGQTKPFVLDVTLNGSIVPHPMTGRAAIGFSGEGKLRRSSWGLNTFLDHLSDDVEILVEAEFIGPQVSGSAAH